MSYSSRHNKNRQILREMKLPCHWCGKEWDNTFHADHLQPVAEGGLDEMSNMVSSCARCNLRRGQELKTRRSNARISARNEALRAAPHLRDTTQPEPPLGS